MSDRGADGNLAIRALGLTKRYGNILAVDRLSFTVPAGTVTAFVGPNGAGKTTTIRMLLGLITPTGGGAIVLGLPLTREPGYLRSVGALIEGPAFYPPLSGERNLEVLAALGGHPPHRVTELLELVGLVARRRDPVGSYSTGMKQRLAIAAALLPAPALLVLDEPTNGLDPPGIMEVRSLLRSLAEAGTTVFVSSHFLAELEQVADWLVMIKGGRLVFEGLMEQALAGHAGALIVRSERPEQSAVVKELAAAAGYAVGIAGGRVRIEAPPEFAGELNRRCIALGVTLVELCHQRTSLEEVFMSMDREQRDAASLPE